MAPTLRQKGKGVFESIRSLWGRLAEGHRAFVLGLGIGLASVIPMVIGNALSDQAAGLGLMVLALIGAGFASARLDGASALSGAVVPPAAVSLAVLVPDARSVGDLGEAVSWALLGAVYVLVMVVIVLILEGLGYLLGRRIPGNGEHLVAGLAIGTVALGVLALAGALARIVIAPYLAPGDPALLALLGLIGLAVVSAGYLSAQVDGPIAFIGACLPLTAGVLAAQGAAFGNQVSGEGALVVMMFTPVEIGVLWAAVGLGYFLGRQRRPRPRTTSARGAP